MNDQTTATQGIGTYFVEIRVDAVDVFDPFNAVAADVERLRRQGR